MIQKKNDFAVSYEIVAPEPGALIESLRSVGYTLEAAIADLIDNSVTAGAKNIKIDFVWNGPDSYITIVDDGAGMTSSELVSAMRAGSQNPLLQRSAKDLGRFGLGLKTASFSYCRSLTVSSKTSQSGISTRRWDLDYVGKAGEWRLLSGTMSGSEARIQALETQQQGTVVLWERMDRIAGGTKLDDQRAQKRFLKNISSVGEHLGIVFHRFLTGPSKTAIFINGREIKAWDPFLTDEPATQQLPLTPINFHNTQITVRPYILPHRSRLSQQMYDLGAGPRGWTAQQGFYVYRNRRLLLAGDWLGLGFQKEEPYKLVRIAIDLPNSMDQEWNIDVKKSRSRPPGILQDELRGIAEIARERAISVYRHRGKVLARQTSGTDIFIWQKEMKEGQIRFKINRELPLISDLLQSPHEYREKFKALLRLLEETLPVPLIILENVNNPGTSASPFEGNPPSEVLDVMKQFYHSFRQQGYSPEQSRERLMRLEPFQDFRELILSLDDSM